MKIDISKLVRENIRELSPYSSARSEFSGPASVLLDANENPYGSPLSKNYNRYPDPLQTALKDRLAEMNALARDQICVGNGSDQLIDLIIRIFCRPAKDAIIICPPTFKMYEVAAAVNDARVKRVMLDKDFQIDADTLLQEAGRDARVIFLCSPNNPTGNHLDRKEMEKIITRFNGIVVVDEAYIHFSTQPSLAGLLKENNNLVILQTLSKDWGMAGLRVGMAFADKEIIHWMTAAKTPYNINSVSQRLALEALEQGRRQVEAWRMEIIEQRQWLRRRLSPLSFVQKIYPSDANFLLVRFKDAQKKYDDLRAAGIIIRNQSSQPGLDNCLRITVGTPDENQKLISALKKMK